MAWTIEVREAFLDEEGKERGRWIAFARRPDPPGLEELEALRDEFGCARAYDGSGAEVTLMRHYTSFRKPL